MVEFLSNYRHFFPKTVSHFNNNEFKCVDRCGVYSLFSQPNKINDDETSPFLNGY